MALAHVPPDEAVAAAAARHEFTYALTDAAIWFEQRPGARIPPSPLIQVHVQGANREEKLADLQAIAESWETEVIPLPDGTRSAQVVFGGLTFEAHVAPVFRTHGEWKAAMDRARDAKNANVGEAA